MPAMPIARQQRADRRRDERDEQRDQRRDRDRACPRTRANGRSATTTTRKISVRPASRMPSAISFGVLRRVGALDERDHAVEEALAGLLRDLDDDAVREHARAAGDRAAVAAGLADDGRRLAGDRRLVDRGDALDRRCRRRGSARRPRRRRRRRGAARTAARCVAVAQRRDRLACASRAAWRPAPCRGPRRSPRRGCAKTTVSHSQIATVNVNQAGSSPPPSGSPPKTWISQATVVITAPISTTNITGLRTMCARVELAQRCRAAPGAGSPPRTASAAGAVGHRDGPPGRARG